MPGHRREPLLPVEQIPLQSAKEKNSDPDDSGMMSKPNAARKRLGSWFSGLSPDRRVELAEEAEAFRRGARIVRNSRGTEDPE